MDKFFQELGALVLERWKKENFSLAKFPAIATAALDARSPAKHVDLPAFIREFLLNDEQPFQTHSGFGQPELVAYNHERFYIQLLFWLDGTTDIHQHEFSGAFHVMAGSSIHAHFTFEKEQAVTAHFRMGNVVMKDIELLETGRTVPIVSGRSCIHSLFHLDTPSVTVVVRTQNDPGTSPQFNFLPPHIAFDPVFSDPLTMRRKQLLDVLELSEAADYPEIAGKMIHELDFERGFFILQHARGYLSNLGEWESVIAVFEKKHGKLAKGVAETLEEGVRRDTIKDLRSAIVEPEHRFFLALLLNVSSRKDLFALVKKRFPKQAPAETILRWAGELSQETDFGTAILDAHFPWPPNMGSEEHAGMLMAALRYFLAGGKKPPIPAPELKEMAGVFAASSLGILVE